MSAVINIVGQKFGRLLVTGRAENKSSDRQALWLCSCDCGCTHIAKSRDLRAGKVKSCGCLPNRGNLKHGMRKSEEYGIWCKIKSRCCNEADAAYASYGGRGIRVCDDWLNSFDSFYKCMGARPSPEH